MPEERDGLYHDGELARFYDLENGWAADLEFCRLLAAGAASVLDLGCGTGRFAATLAREGRRRIVGVDPASPMLDIARWRAGGELVRWVEDDARTVRLGECFDLIVLTGHAFQVFLTDADRQAVLETIAHHLVPSGRFIFDSRNPAREEWREWTPDASRRMFDHPELGRVLAWNDVSFDAAAEVATYGTFYRVEAEGRTYSSSSRIAFPSRPRLAEQMAAAGLTAERWLGDWQGGPWTADAPEIIPIGRLASRA